MRFMTMVIGVMLMMLLDTYWFCEGKVEVGVWAWRTFLG